jgi:hypothetical protein
LTVLKAGITGTQIFAEIDKSTIPAVKKNGIIQAICNEWRWFCSKKTIVVLLSTAANVSSDKLKMQNWLKSAPKQINIIDSTLIKFMLPH